MITYEYPFNERIRTLLRLEDLFEKATYFIQQGGAREHHACLLSLFEILEVAGRADLKLDLIQADAHTIKLRFIATDGYYLYRHRFQFHTEPADIALGTPNIPKGEAKHDEFFGDVEVYHGVLDIELLP